MTVRLSLFALVLLAPLTARGQSCPTNAETGDLIHSGAPVTILGIHEHDAYAEETSLIGQTGTAATLRREIDCWYGGEVTLGQGDSRYFYRVAVDANGASSSMPQCTARAMRERIETGTQLVVQDVHPDDYNYGSADLIPDTVVEATGPLTVTDDCWYSGTVRNVDTGITMSLYRVSFALDTDRCAANALSSLPGPGGTVAISTIHEDAGISDRERLSEGLTVTLGEGGVLSDDCWYSGPLTLPDGTTHEATRVSFRRADPSQVRCPQDARVPRIGEPVRVVSVHRSDPYAAVANGVVGVTGAMRRVTTNPVGCWVGGDFLSDSGVRYRFTSVALSTATASPP